MIKLKESFIDTALGKDDLPFDSEEFKLDLRDIHFVDKENFRALLKNDGEVISIEGSDYQFTGWHHAETIKELIDSRVEHYANGLYQPDGMLFSDGVSYLLCTE